MTQDFKDTLLKYLTGNIDEQTSANEPQFGTVETITNNLATYISNNISGTWKILDREFIQGKDSNGNDIGLFLFRGNETLNENTYGFLVVLDNGFQPIQMIKNFTSNVRIGEIKVLKVDNTGNFYMIEKSVDSGKWRIILLNNILIKLPSQSNYYCEIRASYNLPNSMQTFTMIDAFRSVTGNNYGFICNVNPTEQDANGYLIFNNLKVEVGQPNEWTEYSTAVTNYDYISGYWSWDNDSYIFQSFGYIQNSKSIQKHYLNNSNISSVEYYMGDYAYSGGWIKADVAPVNNTLFYIGLSLPEDEVSPRNQKYMILKCLNGNISTIFEKTTTTTLSSIWDRFAFFQKNGIVFFREFYQINSQYNFDVGLIANDNAYYFTIENVASTQASWYYANKSFFVTMQFNLINYYIPTSTYEALYNCIQIYNSNNYNGLPYENINSLAPNSGIIYDSNDKIIFARNLYNKNINGNTTISTIEVPNTFLNDTTIEETDLLGETNVILNEETNSITKNIYESLDINFFNTLVMKNSNNPLNEIINNPGASRLNSSISQVLDYSNVYANKIRINYTDNTNNIETVGIPTITNGIATYNFTIYVSKAISNIEIISNDENTSYQTIEGNFNIGSTYTITQDVRVE